MGRGGSVGAAAVSSCCISDAEFAEILAGVRSSQGSPAGADAAFGQPSADFASMHLMIASTVAFTIFLNGWRAPGETSVRVSTLAMMTLSVRLSQFTVRRSSSTTSCRADVVRVPGSCSSAIAKTMCEKVSSQLQLLEVSSRPNDRGRPHDRLYLARSLDVALTRLGITYMYSPGDHAPEGKSDASWETRNSTSGWQRGGV